jgi:N-acetylmuramoyl-L-alanine amidase
VSGASEIIDHPSPNHSPRKKDVRVDTVLIHHTASDELWRTAAWLCHPDSGVSAHYLVGPLGDVVRLVPENQKAWHAGKGRLPWETVPEYDVNHRSVGIEVVNPGDGKTPFTEAQYRALEWLVPDICKRLGNRHLVRPDPSLIQGVPPMKLVEKQRVYIIGHRDVAPGRKTDPADNFDWGRIRQALAGGLS